MNKSIRSIDEFKRRYYPGKWEQDQIDKMSAQELGKYWAKLTIEQIRKALVTDGGDDDDQT